MRKLTWMSAPLLLLVLLLGACSGGEDGADTPDQTPAANGAATGTPATQAPEATSAGGSGSDGSAERLAALAEQFASATFTATYNVSGTSGTSGTSGSDAMTGEWTWYQDGASRFRMDFSADGASGTMIDAEDSFVICAEGACLRMPADGSSPMPNPGDLLAEQVDEFQADAMSAEVREAGAREIAGVQAQCFEFDDTTNGSSGTVCYSDGGIPLFMENETAEGDFRMEATSFEDSVSDEDFEPPYPVSTLPTGN